jgi:hypothetical protein
MAKRRYQVMAKTLVVMMMVMVFVDLVVVVLLLVEIIARMKCLP